MTLLCPDPTSTSTAELPPSAGVGDSAEGRRSTSDAQAMIDLHFVVRDRIADLLAAPHPAGLDELRTALDRFLDAERRLFLLATDELEEAPIDRRELLQGRGAVQRELRTLTSPGSGTSGLARGVEALRLAFLHHAEIYLRHRSRSVGTTGSTVHP